MYNRGIGLARVPTPKEDARVKHPYQYCKRLKFNVGPYICDTCRMEGCTESLAHVLEQEKEREKNERRKTVQSERLYQRRRVMLMVERDLQRTELHETTGFPIHPDSKRETDVPSAERVRVVGKQGEVGEPLGKRELGKVERPKLGGVR